jgi:ABC-2 type transport system ATP-binding protein
VTVQDGSGLPGAGHVLLLTTSGEETYDLVRDVIADLGLGLVRMEQRRHHISEVFKDSDAERKEAVGHGN